MIRVLSYDDIQNKNDVLGNVQCYFKDFQSKNGL